MIFIIVMALQERKFFMETSEEIKREEQWVETLCEQLKECFHEKYLIINKASLAHDLSLNECLKYDEKEKNIYLELNALKDNKLGKKGITWNVDLFIGEKSNGKVIPRVVIEVKFHDINTHDPITYSYKADLHKRLFPTLKYGLLIGNYGKNHKEENCYIPPRCINFGSNFDFIFLYKGNNKGYLSDEEMRILIEIIDKNVKNSKQLENYYNNPKGYWYINKEITFNKLKNHTNVDN